MFSLTMNLNLLVPLETISKKCVMFYGNKSFVVPTSTLKLQGIDHSYLQVITSTAK